MEYKSVKKELIGTLIEIKLPKKISFLFPSLFDEIERIEKKYSRFLDDSYLEQINFNLGIWQKVDFETIFLIRKSMNVKEKTNGNFDITLKNTLENLGYDKNYSFKVKKTKTKFKESNEEIKIDKNKILLNKEIEFGGIGKGYAIDRISKIIEEQNIFDYYINAGGDILARHENKKEYWEILLEHPDDDKRVIGKIDLNNMSISSSSPNKRNWKESHHLINSKTKKPISEIKSIFVMTKTAIESDSYATALFTSGFISAIEISKKLKLPVLIISSENKMYKSDDFNVNIFKLK
ncbi:FAD:protein FMN transferase [archaeon]|jgi:FAD:protein FMN transferase|nr:FAD:protein FMN transferase [archaeon]MBT4352368.1 FAD:protein FMN transferase [archaeon]MBT4646978.1 FAD:protein FMN transferase [archaeon]MBT6822573.1 FAD:protein FMN transferase [archaeon]MBT7392758.1 FAD:protein FMN transferase [archaeon]